MPFDSALRASLRALDASVTRPAMSEPPFDRLTAALSDVEGPRSGESSGADDQD